MTTKVKTGSVTYNSDRHDVYVVRILKDDSSIVYNKDGEYGDHMPYLKAMKRHSGNTVEEGVFYNPVSLEPLEDIENEK